MTELKSSVDAYRDAFNARLGERFGVKALAIWPFGPQVFLCNEPVESLADLDGLKIRSFTSSMSTLLENLGATPVTLSFPEVYPALQRGVASCGVTSPTSSNTGKWPEVTSYLYPLSVSGSIQAHIVSLDWLNSLPEADRIAFEADLKQMEDEMWDLALTTNDTAQSCSTGGNCPEGGLYTSYDMKLVSVSDADKAKVAEISATKVLPEWAAKCNANYPDCSKIWNETVGAARGIVIE
jgi:TRAP-type C4-dicarboxylate transport system substrate-binding protein